MIFIKSDDLCVALLPNMMKYCYGLWVLLSGSVVNIDTIYGHITFFLWIHMISCDHTWLILCNVLHHIFLWRMVFMLYDFLHQVKFSSYFFNASWGFRPWIAVLSGMDFAFMLFVICKIFFSFLRRRGGGGLGVPRVEYWSLQFYAFWNSTYNTPHEGSPMRR